MVHASGLLVPKGLSVFYFHGLEVEAEGVEKVERRRGGPSVEVHHVREFTSVTDGDLGMPVGDGIIFSVVVNGDVEAVVVA